MGHMSHRDWQTKQWVLQGLIRVRASHEISLSLCHGCALQESLYGMHVLSLFQIGKAQTEMPCVNSY